ncbi:MAG: hypothetical protein AAF830_04660 [Pseudomonadota bacterium]
MWNRAPSLPPLEGRAWEIARTIQREIADVAPFAELSITLGSPTWSFHERVVSLVFLHDRCQLTFWDGACLDGLHPDLKPLQMTPERRSLPLRSMLDIDESVRNLLSTAFQAKIDAIAKSDHACVRTTAFR